jgi:cation diffusion facilitator CzcD-associated flavoprotein CzcO
VTTDDISETSSGRDADQKHSPWVATIGAGMSGLCTAAELQESGIDSYTIFEKANEVGETWRDNAYPRLMCGVPSRYYIYTFRPNSIWSHIFPAGREIQAYLCRFADDRGHPVAHPVRQRRHRRAIPRRVLVAHLGCG